MLLALIFVPSYLIFISYHPLIDFTEALKMPESAKLLDGQGRVYQLGGGFPYILFLTNKGWIDTAYYLFAKNSLDADSNVLFNIPSANLYKAFMTKRQDIIQHLLENEAQGNFYDFTATQSGLHQRLLSILSVDYLISPFQFNDKNLLLVKTIKSEKNFPPFYIYHNLASLPRVRISSKGIAVANLEEAIQQLSQDNFDINSPILENAAAHQFAAGVNKAEIIEENEISLKISVESEKGGILVLADSYYPGWKATIDGKETQIYPANINQRAVFIPKGQHEIIFSYAPSSFYIGLWTTIGSYLLWFILFMKAIFKRT